jgi:hypothetical protein
MLKVKWEGRLVFLTGSAPCICVEQPDGDNPGRKKVYMIDACAFNKWVRENAFLSKTGTIQEMIKI